LAVIGVTPRGATTGTTFASEYFCGVDAARTERRYSGRRERADPEHGACEGDGHRILRRHAKKEGAEHRPRQEGEGHPDDNGHPRQCGRFLHEHRDDRTPLGTERKPDTELPPSTRHRIRQCPVKTNDGKHQGKQTE
jgi:hypothetical protein